MIAFAASLCRLLLACLAIAGAMLFGFAIVAACVYLLLLLKVP